MSPLKTILTVALPMVVALAVAVFLLPFYLLLVLVKNTALIVWDNVKTMKTTLVILFVSILVAKAELPCYTNFSAEALCGSVTISNVTYTNFTGSADIIGSTDCSGTPILIQCPCSISPRPALFIFAQGPCGSYSLTITMPGTVNQMLVMIYGTGSCNNDPACGLRYCIRAQSTCDPGGGDL